MSVIPPFNILLNSISNDLSPRNLHSLVHICEPYIPESEREEIENGLDVFRILKHRNVIGDDQEKARNLEEIVKAMKPKRRDIIKKVRTFIRTNYDPEYDIQSSGESFVYCEPPAVLVENRREPLPLHRYDSSGLESLSVPCSPSGEVRNTENHCSMDCCCWGCNCYARRIPACVLLIMTGIMASLTFLSSLLWFKKIPENLHSKLIGSEGSKAGKYVVPCFGLATIAFLIWWIYRKVRGNQIQIPYNGFTNNINPPAGFDNQSSPGANTVAEKVLTIPPRSVKLHIKKQKRRPFVSGNAGSSLDTAASASVLETDQQQLHFASKQLPRPRLHRNSTMEDGGLQTDGACGSEETDEFQTSRESLYSYSDYSSDEPILKVPPMIAE
ncbi:uncharacterized protein LOC116286535 [Actinia tenebrosa]|uniref:Uncharacterized protein LOC116286535 n=1 Tax=Actinia tenebrosa TaxID=6105 RepID=A0A6P8H933_ACTTE|nr:uncharacterized protein LOC116286535 [Actinia tenebrosa]